MAKIRLTDAVADYAEYKEDLVYIAEYDTCKAETIRRIEELKREYEVSIAVWLCRNEEINDLSDRIYAYQCAEECLEEIERLVGTLVL